MLSEVFGVPASIERVHDKNRKQEAAYCSFYDEYPEEMIPTSSNHSEYFSIDSLLEADRVNGDCSQTNKTCAHIYPEGMSHTSILNILSCSSFFFEILS